MDIEKIKNAIIRACNDDQDRDNEKALNHRLDGRRILLRHLLEPPKLAT